MKQSVRDKIGMKIAQEKMKNSLTFLWKFGMMGAYLKGNEGVQ